jgi:hypothetical protein
MRLDDLTATESPAGAGRIRLETLVADVTGAEDHRLVIDGPEELVRTALSEGEVNIRIDPNGTRRDWYERYEPVRQQELDRLAELARLARPQDLYASMPPSPDSESSILASLHRIRGQGSVYVLGGQALLGAGSSFVMWIPLVCSCMGVAFPAAVPAGGDVSLSLAINFLPFPVATSVTPGSAAEVVTFSRTCWPWNNFIPLLTVGAVTTSLAVWELSGATFFP